MSGRTPTVEQYHRASAEVGDTAADLRDAVAKALALCEALGGPDAVKDWTDYRAIDRAFDDVT